MKAVHLIIAVHLFIEGRVQGVCFRAGTQETAGGLGLVGWVRNRVDGTVEAFAQGGQPEIDRLISWCHRGTQFARVDAVRIEPSSIDDTLNRFQVRY